MFTTPGYESLQGDIKPQCCMYMCVSAWLLAIRFHMACMQLL